MATNRQVPLGELAAAAGDVFVELRGDETVTVTGVEFSSRRVDHAYLFFCIPVTVTVGHSFAADAMGAGASALCVERPLDVDIPQIVVSDVRRAMPRSAAVFFDHPADDLTILGV